MNYEGIAQIVNNVVKSSRNIGSLQQDLLLEGKKTQEFKIIQNVFSKYDVSGETLTISALPLVKWA